MRSVRGARIRHTVAAILLGAVVVGACGADDEQASTEPTTAANAANNAGEAVTLRLGYFPNVTHAPALVGINSGIFTASLGASVTLETSPFNAGPEAIEALFGGAIDATFIGPNPAINAFAQSEGEAIRIISGTTSGGAFFVVAPGIDGIEDLKGKTVASPQLGGTQDVALRTWLKDQGVDTDTAGGGEVTIAPQANADTLTAFKDGTIAGAWVPEPWATRLILEGGGKVLVDERDLWPDGDYVTTHLIVSTEFLKAHPDTVAALLAGLVKALDAISADPAAAQAAVNAEIEAATGKPLAAAVITAAWANLAFTADPIASSLETSAAAAVAIDLLEPVDLTDIYELTLLNKVLAERGQPEVQGL